MNICSLKILNFKLKIFGFSIEIALFTYEERLTNFLGFRVLIGKTSVLLSIKFGYYLKGYLEDKILKV